MKAAVYEENSSDFTKVKITEVPKPTASPGHVVVKVKTAAVNPIDWMVMAGYLKGAWPMNLPFTMGYDFAGDVEEIDPSDASSGFAVGDAVFAVNWGKGNHDVGEYTGGSFAEYIKLPLASISKKPVNITYEQAAALALVGTTAYQCIEQGNVGPGSKVLILGGSSAVGSLAIQFAKKKGAWVATTCSSRTMDFVKTLNADKVINYSEEKWEESTELKDIDFVYDCIGEDDGFAKADKVVKAGGYFISIAKPDAGYNPVAHQPRFEKAFFYCLHSSSATQDTIVSMLAANELILSMDKEFPFTDEGITAMLTYQQAGKSVGKNVLKIC